MGPAWSLEVEGNVIANPLIDSRRNIYVATEGGVVHKVTRSGRLLWNYTAPGSIWQTPTLYNGALHISTNSGLVVAINESTADELWRSQVACSTSMDASALSVADGLIILPTSSTCSLGNDHLVALNSSTGSVRWSYKPAAEVRNFMGPISDGSLVFEDFSGQVYALSTESGKAIWAEKVLAGQAETQQGATAGTSVIGHNRIAYATINRGKYGFVAAFNLTTGQAIWQTRTDMPIRTAPTIGVLHPSGQGDLSVVVGIGEDSEDEETPSRFSLIAIDARNGSLLSWRADMESFTKDRHSVETPASNGAVETPKGKGAPKQLPSATIGGDGTVYIGLDNGMLFAMRDMDGDGTIKRFEATSRVNEVSMWNAGEPFVAAPGIAPGLLAAATRGKISVFSSF